MASPGEDTEIQDRLLQAGVRGYYLPDAAMCHFVRSRATGLEFAAERAERNGIYWGINQASQPGFYPRRWLKTIGQWMNDRLRIRRWSKSQSETERARAACMTARWRGRWQGIQLAAQWNCPRLAPRQAA